MSPSVVVSSASAGGGVAGTVGAVGLTAAVCTVAEMRP
jgi:hypothetical protein